MNDDSIVTPEDGPFDPIPASATPKTHTGAMRATATPPEDQPGTESPQPSTSTRSVRAYFTALITAGAILAGAITTAIGFWQFIVERPEIEFLDFEAASPVRPRFELTNTLWLNMGVTRAWIMPGVTRSFGGKTPTFNEEDLQPLRAHVCERFLNADPTYFRLMFVENLLNDRFTLGTLEPGETRTLRSRWNIGTKIDAIIGVARRYNRMLWIG